MIAFVAEVEIWLKFSHGHFSELLSPTLFQRGQRLQVQPHGLQFVVSHLTEILPRHIFIKLVTTGCDTGLHGCHELLF